MQLTIRTYGALKKHYEPAFRLELSAATVEDLRHALGQRAPAALGLLGISRFAINGVLVNHEANLVEGSEVDVLPPFSGG